jgi:type IV pilus assembly protein PilF
MAGAMDVLRRLGALLLAGSLVLSAACAQRPARETPRETPRQSAVDQRNRAEAHTRLAAEYYSRARYDVAIEELNLAIASDATYASAYDMLGLVYMELRDDVQATRNFEQALKLSGSDPDVNNNYGWYLCNRGRERDSLRYFQAAIADTLYRTPEKSLVNAGICSRRMGDLNGAEGYLRRALTIAPTDPNVVFQLADLEYARGRYPKSRDLLAMVAPSSLGPEALWLGVRVENRLGGRDALETYGLQLRKRYPDAKETALFNSGRFE